MSTIYLHIGTAKTGTSAIQSFLMKNRSVLEEKGYTLPLFGINFGSPFINRNGHFLVHRPHNETPEENEAEYQQVQDQCFAILEEAAKQYEGIILTDEGIWQYSDYIKDFWKILREKAEKIGCQVKVVVYLRRQDLLAESLWNQNVKSFHNTSKRFARWIRAGRCGRYPMDYYAQLNKISSGIGKENVIVRVYEKNAFMGGEGGGKSIFSDFLQAVGLTFTSDFTTEEISSNNGLKGNFLEIKRWLNNIPEYRGMNDFMRRPILHGSDYVSQAASLPRTTMFTKEDHRKFMKQFQESNRKVAVEYLGREDGVLFSDVIEDLPLWQWDEKRQTRDLVIVMGEIFCAQQKTLMQQKNQIRALESRVRTLEGTVGEHQGRMDYIDSQLHVMTDNVIYRAYKKIRDLVRNAKSRTE